MSKGIPSCSPDYGVKKEKNHSKLKVGQERL